MSSHERRSHGARRPLLLLPVVAAALVLKLLGGAATLAVLLVCAIFVVVWSHAFSSSFQRWVRFPLRSRFRRLTVYRKAWPYAMARCELDGRVAGQQVLPRLGQVTSTGSVDWVRVGMAPGQQVDDWSKKSAHLAIAFGALDCRVRPGEETGEIELRFLVDGPLRGSPPESEAPDPRETLAA